MLTKFMECDILIIVNEREVNNMSYSPFAVLGTSARIKANRDRLKESQSTRREERRKKSGLYRTIPQNILPTSRVTQVKGGRRADVPCAPNFHYITSPQICQAKNAKNFAQIYIPKFVHFAYCIFLKV